MDTTILSQDIIEQPHGYYWKSYQCHKLLPNNDNIFISMLVWILFK